MTCKNHQLITNKSASTNHRILILTKITNPRKNHLIQKPDPITEPKVKTRKQPHNVQPPET